MYHVLKIGPGAYQNVSERLRVRCCVREKKKTTVSGVIPIKSEHESKKVKHPGGVRLLRRN